MSQLTLDGYQKMAEMTATWGHHGNKLGGLPPLVYCAMGLAGEAGEVVEKVKKMYRDNDGLLDQKTLKKELGDVLWYLSQLAYLAGLDLSEVGQANIDKLASRRERGVLQGSGDDR